ncbi:MAG: antibiotic transporter ATP-binding protein [Frankiales bacterium]|nr:antibiotic transporter ATP-binding protein [Frankiales bacterium]
MPGVLVLASHDRAFLDSVSTALIDLDPAADGPTRYGGNYTQYLTQRLERRQRWERRFAEEQDELAALRRAVAVTARDVAPGRGPRDNEKMGYGHTAGRVQNQISRRVRDTKRRLSELERSQVGKPPPPLRFHPAALVAAGSAGVLVSLRDVRLSGRLDLAHLEVSAGGRLLVTGANGSGKSTLLAVLAGRGRPAALARAARAPRTGPSGRRTVRRTATTARARSVVRREPAELLRLGRRGDSWR